MNEIHRPCKRLRIDDILSSRDVEPNSVAYLIHQDGRRPEEDPCEKVALQLTASNSGSAYSNTMVVDAGEELVCFGMITNMPGLITNSTSGSTLSCRAELTNSQAFTTLGDSPILGTINTDHLHLIEALLEEPTLDLDLQLTAEDDTGRPSRSRFSRKRPCLLSITLYGPASLFEEIGNYFQEENIYLQDPVNPQRDVKYFNPHRLSSIDLATCPRTSDLRMRESELVDMEERIVESRLLDIFESNDDLAETIQPDIIQTQLERHQKQALTFMIRREKGWGFSLDPAVPDIWDMREDAGGVTFVNMVSGQQQRDSIEDFFGGVVADPMGFGKTLTMIALVAVDQEAEHCSHIPHSPSSQSRISSNLSLVIVPPPMMGTWEAEVATHVAPGALIVHQYHGKSRNINSIILQQHKGIILTTYQTVSADWKTWSKSGKASPLFETSWKRIVLDEAHNIKNPQTQTAVALSNLVGRSRWAVTGTPIQNRLKDFSALLTFLKVYPYSDQKQFDRDITRVWKSGDMEEATRRLVRLSRHLLLRRPQKTVQLPKRRDLQCPIDFNEKERAFYNEIRNGVIAQLDEAIISATAEGSGTHYFNVLRRIEAMRMICNLGVYYKHRHSVSDALQQTMDVSGDWTQVAQQCFTSFSKVTPVHCRICDADIESLNFDPQDSMALQFSQCLRCICSGCANLALMNGEMIRCGHEIPCSMAPVILEPSYDEDAAPLTNSLEAVHPIILSTKVSILVNQLQALEPGVKSVVFSTWRMSLDMIESGLRRSAISVLRFDGKVPQAERQSVVNRFQQDPSVRVLLLTLSCGAVGLTLTAASRAYLLEPHWNPTVEDQALARIHRMGQKREVTTVRFFVRDTFEERVIKVQDSKKGLAELLLDPHDRKSGGGEMKHLESLRSLI